MIKRIHLVLIAGLFLFCCGKDDPQPAKSKTAYELTDPKMRGELANFVKRLNSEKVQFDPTVFDTTEIIIKTVSSPDLSKNLTKIERSEDFTIITLHKEFLSQFKINLLDMYLINVSTGKLFDCIGPFREFKTAQDVEGFRLYTDEQNWACSTCFPITYHSPEAPDKTYPWDGNFESFWLKDWQVGVGLGKVVFDMSELEKLYQEHEIPICNK
jgi:hypothetical protein